MYERILVATDGSDAATRAADEAIDLAAAMHAALHVLFVVDRSVLPLDAHAQHLTELLENEGRESVDDIADTARARGVDPVTAVVREGVAGDVVLEYAAGMDADLVVVGTHSRPGLGRLLLGSTAQYVVARSPVPTLVVSGVAADETGP